MQRAGRDSVGVRQVAAGYGTELHEIEVGILGDKRIEGPFDQRDAAGKSVLALKELEPATNGAVAESVENGGHVRVQEGLAGAPSGDGHGEAHQFAAAEGAED